VWLLALLHKKKGNYDEALKLYYQALDQVRILPSVVHVHGDV
jgi:hypothetical protein